jgi:hypothetical protein
MFEPDIIVTERGDYAERFIVVEVKSHARALLPIEDQLRTYMVHNNFSLGMLVAPGAIRLYKNRFTSYGPDSIALLGAFSLPTFDEFATIRTADPASIAQLEDAVQTWVESIPKNGALAGLAPDLQRVLEREFAPYVRIGEVRAARHRRWHKAASDVPRR